MFETDHKMVSLFQARKEPSSQMGPEKREHENARPKWNTRAWDAFEYRANVPSLAQYDRDKSTRASRAGHINPQTNLLAVGTKRSERKKRPQKSIRGQERRHRNNNGGHAGSSQPEEVEFQENNLPWKVVESNLKDKAWVHKVKKNFIKKFYAPSTLATKNTKRKKVLEILENMEGPNFPLTPDRVVELAAVLDATGMKAGDQYLAEAKSLHIETGEEWDMMLDRQMNICKRAMARDKGPEVRAKEVRPADIDQNEWSRINEAKNEPKRVAWSYTWACTWMLRAIEAANVRAKDVVVKVEERQVRLNIRKSKTDQKGVGAWRTLECCRSLPKCDRDCPFELAVLALNDMQSNEATSPLFPDAEGGTVSKIHLVNSWINHLDNEMSGHSARRSGAMSYARKGLSVHSIQFLGRWKSSAVFRYIEEAMTELPMNVKTHAEPKEDESPQQEKFRKKALRPKSAAAPPKAVEPQNEEGHADPDPEIKPLLKEEQGGQVYAMSRSRGKWTKHIVGQAAWGIPLDSWSTICGWNFAKRNVKVELTQKPPKGAPQCKKCFKLQGGRDRVKGAREWAQQLKL